MEDYYFGKAAVESQEQRMRRLMELLGVEEAAIKSSRGEVLDHVVRTLRDGLDITDFEALELLDGLREVLSGTPPPAEEPEEEPEEEEEELPVATKKSVRQQSTRDHNGRQLGDPLGLGKRYARREDSERDSQGYRRNKPYDPDRARRRS